MPELPDLTVYQEALQRFVGGHVLNHVRVSSPFLLRTVEPPLATAEGRRVVAVHRVGKRIVWELEGDVFLAFHLMIAGRFHWKKAGAALNRRTGLASFTFDAGTLVLTEASTKKRASLHVLQGRAAVDALDAGGVEPLEVSLDAFVAAMRRENHTLKRALTDPHIVAAVGNAYSDEILHRARLSPVQLTSRTSDDAFARLHEAMRDGLIEWTERLRRKAGDGFPEKVTAFHDEMAVHGKFGRPCPRCGSPIQRIVKAENESDYCPTCQTGGKLLADRALSRLLGRDWPRSLDGMQELRERHGKGA